MAKFWKSTQFEELKGEWDRRLRESGFEDAEKEVGGERVLKSPSAYAYRNKDRNHLKQADLEYCQMVMECISREENFKDDLDRIIMERTADGKSIAEISRELKTMLPKDRVRSKHGRWAIRYVRRRYEHKWGIRTWKPEEMQKVVKKKAPTQ